MKTSHHLLRGKKGIIFGALNEASLAWQVAQRCHEEGAVFTLTNKPAAIRLGSLEVLAKETGSMVIPVDITDQIGIRDLVEQTMVHLGGRLDFILHSVGMSENIRKKLPYHEISYDHLAETLDVSAISLHKVVRELIALDALNPHASILSMTFVAAQRMFAGYNDMTEAKSLLESITRNFGDYLGRTKQVRINTISQSPTLSSAGSGIETFSDFYDFAELMSPLGNASAEDCADYCVMMFSDYTRKVTMQTLYHDGGFSSVGMSEQIARLLPRNISSNV